MKLRVEKLQPLGRALMLPIAVLPIAALLLRLGQSDMLDIPFVAAAGNAIFSNLGLIFAAGVGVGLARENHGAAALAGVVGYVVVTEGAKALLRLPPDVISLSDAEQAAWRAKEIAKLSVPAGILSGITAGLLYNRFSNIKLPDYLAFFAGRRFVPIAAGLAGIAGAVLFGYGFPWFETGIDTLSRWVVGAGPIGLFLYGLLNRLLLITGLHHILNNIAWFLLGDFHGATGDLKRFFAGDPSAGGFMSGFFPVMMFGLPAACLAMYRNALPERRKAVGGLLLSVALTSLLTGVTEPIEFLFIFLAPLLFLLHAVLTGLAMVIMDALGVKLGFGFSAGLFDYVLNYGLATRPLLLLPIGAAYAAIYYVTFSWCIRRFNLATPGREPQGEAAAPSEAPVGERGQRFVAALGGPSNLKSVDACTTRLRLSLADPAAIDEPALRALGARGIVRPGGDSLQVVLGPIADQVVEEIRAARSVTGDGLAAAIARALEPAGMRSVAVRGTRLLVALDEPSRLSTVDLDALGTRGWVIVGGGVQLIIGPGAEAVAAALPKP
ncbi:MAG TPA: N-acetylglucosamine-specific PTS transporter subunit IIBC [Sphingomicrobium sp.]|nr:N-acetylglucosamine-specific PTS transporter subunit IIBC [Sphingomicrobium sp.]